jgi:hypothetical protein
VGQSKETKKTPGFIYRPGLGTLQVDCCSSPTKSCLPPKIIEPILPIKVVFDTPNNVNPSVCIGPPIVYTLPLLPLYHLWSVTTFVTGGNGMLDSDTKIYPGGINLYIYVGRPGVVVTIPVFTPVYLVFPGGASGVFETLMFDNLPSNQLSFSPGSNFRNDPGVTLILTVINPIFNGGTPTTSFTYILDGGGLSPVKCVPIYDGGIP